MQDRFRNALTQSERSNQRFGKHPSELQQVLLLIAELQTRAQRARRRAGSQKTSSPDRAADELQQSCP